MRSGANIRTLLMASPDEWFEMNLDAYLNQRPRFKVLDLGLSPDFGIKRFPRATMLMTLNVLRKVLVGHAIPEATIRPLPRLIRSALRVFRSKHEENSAVFELPANVNGENLALVAKYGHHAEFGTAYIITSVHAPPKSQFDAWADLGLLLYVQRKGQVSPQDSAQCNSGQQAV